MLAVGEPHVLARCAGGLSGPVVAAGTGTVLALGSRLIAPDTSDDPNAPNAPDAPDDGDASDADRRARRRDRRISAILHTGLPIRYWDHELGAESPRLFVADADGAPRDLTPDAEPGYRSLEPPGGPWRFDVAARIFLSLPFYRPGLAASRVRCPILFCLAEQDVVTPIAPALAAAARAPRAEVRRYSVGHFDVYLGDTFEQVVADQVEFLVRHLQPDCGA